MLCLFLLFLLVAIHNLLISIALKVGPYAVPDIPSDGKIYLNTIDSLRVQFDNPSNIKPEGSNGLPITGYKIDITERRNEKQTLTIKSTEGIITDGSYKLQFTNIYGTGTTSCLNWNISAYEMETAFMLLPNIDGVSILRSNYNETAPNGYVYTIEFTGEYLVNGNQPNVFIGSIVGCSGFLPVGRKVDIIGAEMITGIAQEIPEIWEIKTEDTSLNTILGGYFYVSIGYEGTMTKQLSPNIIGVTIKAGFSTVDTTGNSLVGKINRGDKIKIGQEIFSVHLTAPFTDTELPLDSYHTMGAQSVIPLGEDTALGNVIVANGQSTITTDSDWTTSIGVGEFIKIGTSEFTVKSITASSIGLGTLSDSSISTNWMAQTKNHITAYKRKKASINIDDDAIMIKKSLETLPEIGNVNAIRHGPNQQNGFIWFITFLSMNGYSACPSSPCLVVEKTTGTTVGLTNMLGAQCTTCKVTAKIINIERGTAIIRKGKSADFSSISATKEISGNVNEVQSITLTTTANDAGGTFAVNFRTTNPLTSPVNINYYETEEDIGVKLESLPTIGSLNITKIDVTNGVSWMITFLSNMGDLPLLDIDTTLLTGTNKQIIVKEIIKGKSASGETFINGLNTERKYSIRVSAKNIKGYGPTTDTIQNIGNGMLPISSNVYEFPLPVDQMTTWPISGSQVGLQFKEPNNQGNSISKYLLEFTTDSTFGTPEVKKIIISSTIENNIIGSFRLKYGDLTTFALKMDTSANEMKKAIESIQVLKKVDVTRSLYLLSGTATDKVTSFIAFTNMLITTPLTLAICNLLLPGYSIMAGISKFTIKTQPNPGDTVINVLPGSGIGNFVQDRSLLLIDLTGSMDGPKGYEWSVTFLSMVGPLQSKTSKGLNIISNLVSVDSTGTITTDIIDAFVPATIPLHYGNYEVNAEPEICNTYVTGAPSNTQIIRIFSKTTITAGQFRLQLDNFQTNCIQFNANNAAVASNSPETSLKAALENIPYIRQAFVEVSSNYKNILLSGSSKSKVTAFDTLTNKLTVVSTGTGLGLSTSDVDVLLIGTLIRVSRFSNNPSIHSCDLTVKTLPIAGQNFIEVFPNLNCDGFTSEARKLSILDFIDYKVTLISNNYPAEYLPTLKFINNDPTCTSWTPANANVYGKIHTLKYEGTCIQGNKQSQTIIADGSSILGGSFKFSYKGIRSPALSVSSLTASMLQTEINRILALTTGGTATVETYDHNSFGKAWYILFDFSKIDSTVDIDKLNVEGSFISGQNAIIDVYPTVIIRNKAKKNDIRGSFRIRVGNEVTEPIAHAATERKIIQELEKLTKIANVDILGNSNTPGTTSLYLTLDVFNGSPLLNNILYQGTKIDITKYIAIGDTITIGVATYTIQSVVSDEITLTTNYLGTSDTNIAVQIGTLKYTKRSLPGFLYITPTSISVVSVVQNTKIFTLSDNHGLVIGDIISVSTIDAFTVATVAGNIVTMVETYTGQTISMSNPKLVVYDNKIYTSVDCTGYLNTNDLLWINIDLNKFDTFKVISITSSIIKVKGTFVGTLIRGTGYISANGYEYQLVFKSYITSLDTIDTIPEDDWTGTEARIGTWRPLYIPPFTTVLGSTSDIQTVTLYVASNNDLGTGAGTTYTLSFRGATTSSITWSSPASVIKSKLELLPTIDGVSVDTTITNNGYIHQIYFWGIYNIPTLPLLTSSFTVGTGGNANNIIISHNSMRSRSALSAYYPNYLSLKENSQYTVRITPYNLRGYGSNSKILTASTASIATLPRSPQSVMLGTTYGPDWLELKYSPPDYDGGAMINMYKIEWDSSPSFDSTSSNYGTTLVQLQPEVQEIVTSFRSGLNQGGTFTISWGGRTTSSLSISCTANEMADALKIITGNKKFGINPVIVTRKPVLWGYSWLITFTQNKGDLGLLTLDGDMMVGDMPDIVISEKVKGFSDIYPGKFTYDVQEIYTISNSPLTGTFQLSFEGKKTPYISVSASAIEIQEALQRIVTVHNIIVTKEVKDLNLNTAIWTVTFSHLQNNLIQAAGNIFLMVVEDISTLSGQGANVYISKKVHGTESYRHILSCLKNGVTYYARVMAYNSQGFGSASSTLTSDTPRTHPNTPQTSTLISTSGTSLKSTWNIPLFDGGATIDKYRIEWYRSNGINSKQMITTSSESGLNEIQTLTSYANSRTLKGFFKLSFNSDTTQNIAWNALATGLGSVKDSLERLSTVGKILVTRKISLRAISGLLVSMVGGKIIVHSTSVITPAISGLALGDIFWLSGQKLTVNGPPTATEIPFTGTFTGLLTAPSKIYKDAFGYVWSITFSSGHVGSQSLITVQPSDEWGGDGAAIVIRRERKGIQPISGYFRLSMLSNGISQTTGALQYDISASDLKKALESITTICTVDVSRSNNGFGYNWAVEFTSDFSNDIGNLIADGSGLTGPSAKIDTSIMQITVPPTGYCEMTGICGQVTLPAQSLEYEMKGLSTGQKYRVRIRAHNSEGWGIPSYTLPEIETPKTIPGIPTSISLIVLSQNSIKIVWNPPISNGGSTILRYIIEWDTSSTFANALTPNFDYRYYYIPNIDDNGPYYYNIPVTIAGAWFVNIKSENSLGKSAVAYPTPASVIPVNREPGPPINVKLSALSSYSLLVTWDIPTKNSNVYGGNGGTPITKYMIEWDLSPNFDSPATFAMMDGTITPPSYIIGSRSPLTGVNSNILQPDKNYYVRVAAFNGQGAGMTQKSDPTFIKTTNQPPSSPRNIKMDILSSSSIQTKWDYPLYDGGDSLTSYTIQYDTSLNFSSGNVKSYDIPIIREMQSVSITSNVLNEIQYMDATVQVTNERQTIRTIITGQDEVQIVQTTNDPVVDEVQTITTTANDINEIQEIRLTADRINEIQAIRTDVPETFETQIVKLGATRKNEVQTITITFPTETNLANTQGSFLLSFDSTSCNFCTLTKAPLTTAAIVIAGTTGGTPIENALKNLANIDQVTVTRIDPGTGGANLIIVYSITFDGDEVAGDVPMLVIQSHTLANNIGTACSTPVIAELIKGNEPSSLVTSTFNLQYSCEAYSDPQTVTGISTACAASETVLCSNCATAFSGTVLFVSFDLTGASLDTNAERIRVNNCIFEVKSVTTTSVTVSPTDEGTGKYCSTFTGKSYSIQKVQSITSAPINTRINAQTPSTVIQNVLQAIPTVGLVTVSQSQIIQNTFVGLSYIITFQQRTGSVPLLKCITTNTIIANIGAGMSCTVTRQSIGSMIYGTFKLKLAKQSDGTIISTGPIPWDVSSIDLGTILSSLQDNGEAVFGSVSVSRSVYQPSTNRWSGGFTWFITFTSRGWNIPIIIADGTTLLNTNSAGGAGTPQILVADAKNPFPISPVTCIDGNEISGSFSLQLNSVVSTSPFVLGVDFLQGSWNAVTVQDTVFKTKIIERMSNILDVDVYRSAATDAKGFIWKITFIHRDNGGDVPTMTVPSSTLSGTNTQITIVENSRGNQLGNTFQLQFDGYTTGPILFSASATEVETQLNNLESIIPSKVSVSRTGPYGPTGTTQSDTTQVLGYKWSITFRSSTWADPTSDHIAGINGNWKGLPAKWDDVWPLGHSKAWGRHAGPLASRGYTINCISSGLTTTANDGSQSCINTVTTQGIGPIRGFFTLTLDSTLPSDITIKSQQTSLPIAHNAMAMASDSGGNGKSMEEILELMPNIGDVSITRSSVDPLNGGYKWMITFLRDKDCPADQRDMAQNLCNSPGNVPLLTTNILILNGLSGSNSAVTACGIESITAQCIAICTGICKSGTLLRGYFDPIQVTGDPGSYIKGCSNCIIGCGANNCVGETYLNVNNVNLSPYLVPGDRILVGATGCILTIKNIINPISATRIDVETFTCPIAGGPFPLYIILPWNANENAMERAIEATSDITKETGIWSMGRQVKVIRTVIGKYGEMSWFIRFLFNPGNTPPGSGNLNPILISSPNFMVTVTENQVGSLGLSGTFTVDLSSDYGPVTMRFDEDPARMEKKLEELNTIGDIYIEKLFYPSIQTGCSLSSCAGGWDGIAVDNDGNRGGYRWKVYFLSNSGTYYGSSFPPGSGNIDPISTSITNLIGYGRSIDITTIVQGSTPLTGSLQLIYDNEKSPILSPFITSDPLKQAMISISKIGNVETNVEKLSMFRIPNAIGTISQDSNYISVTGIQDIRQYLTPGDTILLAPISGLIDETNGDTYVTGNMGTSQVYVIKDSPIIKSNIPMDTTLYPGHNVRIDGLTYKILRTGIEIQKIIVSQPLADFTSSQTVLYYKIQLKNAGITSSTTCIAFNADANSMQQMLNGLSNTANNIASTDIIVTRSSATLLSNGRKGYIYKIYFLGSSVYGNIDQLTILNAGTAPCNPVTNGLVETSTTVNGGPVGYQQIHVSNNGGTIRGGGYYKIVVEGQETTNCIAWDETPSSLQQKLETLPGLLPGFQPGEIIVSRSGNGNSITEIQKLTMTSNTPVTSQASGGYFRLAFTNDGVTDSTICLKYGISANDMQKAINNLINVNDDHINVTRIGDGSSIYGYGYEYYFSFTGPKLGGISNILGNVKPFIIHDIGSGSCVNVLTGLPTLTIQTIHDGRPAYIYNIYFIGPLRTFINPITITNEGTGDCSFGNTNWEHSGGSTRRIETIVIENGGGAEIQSIVIKDNTNTITAGSYKLVLNGISSTQCVNFDASAAKMKEVIEEISTIGAGGVIVSRYTDSINAKNGYIYMITFVGSSVQGNVPLLTKDMTGCAAFAPITATATISVVNSGGVHRNDIILDTVYKGENIGGMTSIYTGAQKFTVLNSGIEKQQIIVKDTNGAFSATGTYSITFGTTAPTKVTLVRWDYTELEMETALISLGDIDINDIVVSRKFDPINAPNGFIYTIYFIGPNLQYDLPEIVISDQANFNAQGTVTVMTLSNGNTFNRLTSNMIPIGLESSSLVEANYIGKSGTNLGIYKVNGFLWTIKFLTNLGDLSPMGLLTDQLNANVVIKDNFVQGSLPNKYITNNLKAGINYYYSLTASTNIGTSLPTLPIQVNPNGKPGKVTNLDSGYAEQVDCVQFVSTGATHLNEIQKITTSATNSPEIQTIITSANPCITKECVTGNIAIRFPMVQKIVISAISSIVSGFYKLTFTRQISNGSGLLLPMTGVIQTVPIAWNAEAITLQNALEGLDTLDPGDIIVTREGDASSEYKYGYNYFITFVGDNVAGDLDLFTITDPTTACGVGCTSFTLVSGIIKTNDIYVERYTQVNMAMGTDTEIQKVIIKADKNLYSGGYLLSFNYAGAIQTTKSCIAYNAPGNKIDSGGDGTSMEELLEELDNIDNVYVTRIKDSTIAPNGYIYAIYFAGNGVRGNVPLLVKSDCVGNVFQTFENNALTTNGVNAIVTVVLADEGGYTTTNKFSLISTATPENLRDDLSQLPIIRPTIQTSRSLADDQGGFQWTIAFDGLDGNLPQMICTGDTTFKTNGFGALCTTNTITDGNVLSGFFIVESSSPIPFDASEELMKSSLEAIQWLGKVQVNRIGPDGQYGFTWIINFITYQGDLPLLSISSSLVGAGNFIDVKEIQKGNTLGGTFKLSFNGYDTTPILYNAKAMAVETAGDGTSMQEKLEILPNIGYIDVQRITRPDDLQGGYSWYITFKDVSLNSGNQPLLIPDSTNLTGIGAVVKVQEIVKGAAASGNNLWLSFTPPLDDGGLDITKYEVRWDTSNTFLADPKSAYIDPTNLQLYDVQKIRTSTSSLPWSVYSPNQIDEIQLVNIVGAIGGTFRLSFREEIISNDIIIGTTTLASIQTALTSLNTISNVIVEQYNPPNGFNGVTISGTSFKVTFTGERGDLPLLEVNDITMATVTEFVTGVTSFRKKLIVFKCSANSGTVKFYFDINNQVIVPFGHTLNQLKIDLEALSIIPDNSLTIYSEDNIQTNLCLNTNSKHIFIVFHRNYGNINLEITSSPGIGNINTNLKRSIDGIYYPQKFMSGTFQITYGNEITSPLNADSSAFDIRLALEKLNNIHTVSVIRERTVQPILGKIDVIQGQTYVTCSTNEICNFHKVRYGAPGHFIKIKTYWFTILTDLINDALPSNVLYLGDLNNQQIGYPGKTETGIYINEWTLGYEWTVSMYLITLPNDSILMQPTLPNLMPMDSTVDVIGKSCDKCYYIPTDTTSILTMGQIYYIQVNAYNKNGYNTIPSDIISATPKQVPDAPMDLSIKSISGKELEIFFSPPSLSPLKTNPNYNNDIISYTIQYDTNADFKHGLILCDDCATSLVVNDIFVSNDLTSKLVVGTKFTVGSSLCLFTVVTIIATKITTANGHGCTIFQNALFPINLYTFPPINIPITTINVQVPPYRYLISGLTANIKYYVRVSASNSVPFQMSTYGLIKKDNRKWSDIVFDIPVDTVPDPPISISLSVRSGTSIDVFITVPIRDGKGTGGTAITHYSIDYDIVPTFDSVGKVAPVDIDITSGLIPFLYSTGPRIYTINNLKEGINIYVRVKAKNSIGYSLFTTTINNPLTPIRPPNSPTNAKITTVNTKTISPIREISVSWSPPTDVIGSTGGLPLLNYKIEWWTLLPREEVQVVELMWITPPTNGGFNLLYAGLSSGVIAFDATAENLRNALMNIGGDPLNPAIQTNIVIGHVVVTRSVVNMNNGYRWSITFKNNNIMNGKNIGNIPMIQINPSLTGGTGISSRVYEAVSGIQQSPSGAFSGAREVQVVVLSNSVGAGGFFRLSFLGSTWTSYLPVTVTAADMKIALEQLPTINTVIVTEGQLNVMKYWKISFDTNVGDQPSLVIDHTYVTPIGTVMDIKDGDNWVGTTSVKCLKGINLCPGGNAWKWTVAPGDDTQLASMALIGETPMEYGFYETTNINTLSYTITGLTTGNLYYVTVTVRNALGYSIRAISFPDSIIPQKQVPNPPTNVIASVYSGFSSQILVSYNAPTNDGGDTIIKYRVEYDTSMIFDKAGKEEIICPSSPINAVWTITTSRLTGTSAIGAGFFKLKLTRSNTILTTEPIPWNAVAMATDELGAQPTFSLVFCTSCINCADQCLSDSNYPYGRREKSGSMQSKLEYLGLNVKVSRGMATVDNGYTWWITFLDAGDDFSFENIATINSLTCSTNTNCLSTYQITAVKKSAGVSYPICTGSKIIPSIPSLTKGQLYYTRVFAYNSIGYSKSPGISPFPQKPMVVPGLPTGVTLQVSSVTELKVIFTPPDDDGGDLITEYKVEWSMTAGFTIVSSSSVTFLSGGAPFYKIISGLTKGVYYFVRVRAKNSQGYGLPQTSSPASLNPQTTPSAPTQVTLAVTSSSMLTLQWNVPNDDGGDPIKSYFVEWDSVATFNSLEAAPQKDIKEITDPTQRSYTVTLLTPGKNYYLRVYAKNSAGNGITQTSSPLFFAPINVVPGKPHTLTAAPTGNSGELLVTWQPPLIPFHGIPCGGTLGAPFGCPSANGFDAAYGGSNIIEYEIQWCESNSFSVTGLGIGGTVITPFTSYTLKISNNLVGGKLYYVRVLAKNAQGPSNYCQRGNSGGYFCPDSLVLLNGNIVTGPYVSTTTLP